MLCIGYAKSATDEGSLSALANAVYLAETNPHPDCICRCNPTSPGGLRHSHIEVEERKDV